jgi:hypothetical protein
LALAHALLVLILRYHGFGRGHNRFSTTTSRATAPIAWSHCCRCRRCRRCCPCNGDFIRRDSTSDRLCSDQSCDCTFTIWDQHG